MLRTLRFEPTDRPCHWETVFGLTKEAFGVDFSERGWPPDSKDEKRRFIEQALEIYGRIIDRYQWDALAVWCPWCDPDMVAAAKQAFGDRILVGTMLGENVWAIDYISARYDWMRFAQQLFEAPAALHEYAEGLTQTALAMVDRLAEAQADFILLVDDVAFNQGCFLRPEQFS